MNDHRQMLVNEGGPFPEKQFKDWYSGWANKAGLNPDPDPNLHKYDYRAAYSAGAVPEVDPDDGFYHWPSQFKHADHPNRFIKQSNGRLLDSLLDREVGGQPSP